MMGNGKQIRFQAALVAVAPGVLQKLHKNIRCQILCVPFPVKNADNKCRYRCPEPIDNTGKSFHISFAKQSIILLCLAIIRLFCFLNHGTALLECILLFSRMNIAKVAGSNNRKLCKVCFSSICPHHSAQPHRNIFLGFSKENAFVLNKKSHWITPWLFEITGLCLCQSQIGGNAVMVTGT